MTRQILLVVCVLMFTAMLAVSGNAQRKSVPAAEVNGTFRKTFPAKFKKSSSDIRIYALGGGKLHIAMDLVYPMIVRGELSANLGELDGQATIVGDTATYESSEFGPCKITIKFVRPGSISVSQEGTDADCGFGHNVTADGVYRKFSSAKPTFGK